MNDLKTFLSEEYECENLITFYGAYYEEGLIKIILEMMDLGSLWDLINIMWVENKYPIDEGLLSYISRELLLGL